MPDAAQRGKVVALGQQPVFVRLEAYLVFGEKVDQVVLDKTVHGSSVRGMG